MGLCVASVQRVLLLGIHWNRMGVPHPEKRQNPQIPPLYLCLRPAADLVRPVVMIVPCGR